MSLRGFRADRGGMSYRVIEQEAAAARSVLAPGVALDAALPGRTKLFENLDRYSVTTRQGHIRLDFAVTTLPTWVEAQTRFDPSTNKVVIEVSEDTYRQLERNYPRALHTVRHEAGHAIMHTNQLLRMSTIPHPQMALQRAAPGQHQVFEDTEWQADGFAAALAAPAAGMEILARRNGGLSIPMVRQAFGLSAEAAQVRIKVFTKYRRELTA